MVKSLLSSEIFSHPDVLLIDHLNSVAESCVGKLDERQHRLTDFFQKEYWKDLMWLVGFLHDFGKATSFFQEYLKEGPEEKKKMKGSPLTSHSLLSALIAFFVAKEYVKDKEGDLLQMMPYLVFLIVKKHHGNIDNPIPVSDEPAELETEFRFIKDQTSSIDQLFLIRIIETVNIKLNLEIEADGVLDFLNNFNEKKFRREMRTKFKSLRGNQDTRYYLVFQYIYSILLHSDKMDAIFHCNVVEGYKKIDDMLVESYKDLNFKPSGKHIDEIRNRIFDEVNNSINTADLDRKIFSFNVPTGSGKNFNCFISGSKIEKPIEK